MQYRKYVRKFFLHNPFFSVTVMLQKQTNVRFCRGGFVFLVCVHIAVRVYQPCVTRKKEGDYAGKQYEIWAVSEI